MRQKTLTLLSLQNKLKKEPDAYQDDFAIQLRHFESALQVAELRPGEESKQLGELVSFISHTAPLYGTLASHVPALLMKMVERQSSGLHMKLRRQVVMALTLMRQRDFVAPEVLLPFLFRLFRINDKELRRHTLSHIINDIKRLNVKSKSQKVNATLQNFMYKVLEEDDATAAQYALVVMVDLYRRRIWTNAHTVNIIAKALFSRHSKIVMVALKFFLGKYAKVSVEEAEAKEDAKAGISEKELGRGRRKAMHQLKKGAKKTRARRARMKKDLKKLEDQRDKEAPLDTLFPAIEVLHDPQGIAERLFATLQKSHERWEIRLLMMQVLAKCIACHELVILNFYPYLQRIMEPYHRDVTHLLLIAIHSLHRLVPPEACEPLLRAIANHFVNDKAEPDVITVGLNTIREMCRRQPLILPQDLLLDLTAYKGYKRDKGVSMAAKSLIYLYRELHPTMLKKKDRGKFHDPDNTLGAFGAPKPADKVKGAELLYQKEMEERQAKIERAMERASQRGTSEAGTAGSESRAKSLREAKEGDEDFEWQVSDAESDGSGEWVDVSDDEGAKSDGSGSDEDDDEEIEEEGEEEERPAPQPAKKGGAALASRRPPAPAPAAEAVADDDCPSLVPIPDALSEAEGEDDGDESGEESGSDDEGDEEEEDDDKEGSILRGLDPLKLEAQKRQLLLDLQHPPAAPRSGGDAASTIAPTDAASLLAVDAPVSDALTRILTPRDFERIEQLMAERKGQNVAPSTLKRRAKREAVRAALSEETIEWGTDKRTNELKEQRREKNLEFREKFKAKNKKQKKGGGTTNREKQRRKNTTFVKHSTTISRKRKASAKDKMKGAKKQKTTMAKFKTKRGF